MATQPTPTKPAQIPQSPPLTIAPSAFPTRTGADASPNPFVESITASWRGRDAQNRGIGYAVTVPAADEKARLKQIRDAGASLGVGVGTKVIAGANGTVTIHYKARPKRVSQPVTPTITDLPDAG